MTYVPVDVIIDHKAKQKHLIDTLNLFAYVILLVLVLVTTWFLKRRKRLHIHETGLAIIYGLIMGAALRYFGVEVKISSVTLVDKLLITVPQDYVLVEARNLADKNANQTHIYAYEFRGELQPSAKLGSQISYASVDPEVFFNIILPPIVLNAGLSLKRRHFFRNIGAIFSYAFIGTTISVAFVGSFIYGTIHLMKSFLNLSYLADEFSLSSCLYFGAIISPTDPLAVLAIFQELGVDVNLFALVFGESILNDAVSIVLTHSIDQFSVIYSRNPYYSLLSIIWACVYNFIKMFFNSCLIGILFGIITALTTKFTKLTESPLLETSLVVLMSYSSFLSAEVIDASGIVAILLCGITQAHYTINNLSFEARERIKNLFELLTFLCENFLFLAVGVCFWQRNQTWNFSFIGIAFVGVTIARAISVYPLTSLLNLGRRNKIPKNFQHLIAWGGAARGVISYSLAAKNTVGDARRIMLSTTSVIVIVSVIAVGSSVTSLLKWLKIPFTECDNESDDQEANNKLKYDAQSSNQDCRSSLNHYSGNNPGWLVRPKRISICPNSDASTIADRMTTPSACRHRHHRRQNCDFQPHNYNSLEATPVLDVETIGACYHQHHSRLCRSRLGVVDSTDCSVQITTATPATNEQSHEEAQSSLPVLHELESGKLNAELNENDQVPSTGNGSVASNCQLNSGLLLNEEAMDGNSQQLRECPYENAHLVRRWRNLDNNFIKPLLTNSQPTLIETLPALLRPLAYVFTSDEQLMRSSAARN